MYYFGNNYKEKKSTCVQYRCNLFSLNIFDVQLAESTNAEPTNTVCPFPCNKMIQSSHKREKC
jgi:hypothetical protein